MIDWLTPAKNRIAKIPGCQDFGAAIARRISPFFLNRLPRELAQEMIELLPSDDLEWEREREIWRQSLRDTRRNHLGDLSIGYEFLVEIAQAAMGCEDLSLPDWEEASETRISQIEERAHLAADAFLWGISADLPAELKNELRRHLPLELTTRMKLTEAPVSEARVA